jgi:branched-chain amino acid transport system permease protein
MGAVRRSILARTASTPIILTIVLLAIALLAVWVGSGIFTRTIVEIFIRVMIVVGLYTFIGNSGVISFGHIGFMCMGAYATAWFTIPPAIKRYSLRGLPEIIAHNQLPFFLSISLATIFAGIFAYIFGRILVRLSGIAGSIATFAMLAMINTVYSNWESVTGATSSIVGIPRKTDLWTGFAGAELAVIVAYLYAISRSGLMLRAARDEAIAASASGVNIVRERLRAFVISGLILGAAGALYAHFLGVVNPDAFYLGLTFISLSMLVVGGMNSLSGAVVGVVVLSAIIEVLRSFEKGIAIGAQTWALPRGTQEIAIGLVMIVILVFRPSGITGNRELSWTSWPSSRLSTLRRKPIRDRVSERATV